LPIRFLFATCRTAIVLGLILLAMSGVPVSAQSFPFELRVKQGNNVFLVPNGASVTMVANAVGQTQSLNFTATYTGVTSVSIAQAPALLGNTDFTVELDDKYPLKLNPQGQFSFKVTYKPSTAATASAQVGANYLEAAPPGTTGTTAIAGSVTLNLTGTAPSLSVNYFLTANGNVVAVAPGGSVQFPPTLVNTTAQATIIIANHGSGAGTVNSISISGTAFQPLGLPLLPVSIPTGTDVRFAITYAPTQVGADTGSLAIDLGGIVFNVGLTGSSIQSKFQYQLLTASDTIPFAPNQVVALPDTNVGETSSATIRVQNAGSAPGTLSNVGTTAGPFAITDAPLLPATLNPQDVLTFTLSFAPVQAGKATGKLRIGNDLFDLTGSGLGPNLVFSYVSGTTTNVQAGGAVIFSPIQVGSSSSVPFTVMNSGTKPATIATVAVGDTHGIYQLQDLPDFPVTLNSGDSVTFTIVFAPATTGFANATLQINSQLFALSGSGTPPPPLPAIQFTGASGTVDPQSQPAVGLTLAAPYPLALNGTLTISITSASFTPDPSIQFSTGSKTVSFTIPANSTQAVFANSANQIRLQTGTTAGSISIAAALTTQSGLDVTPAPPPILTLTVLPSAPHIVSAVARTATSSSFTVLVTGFSTTRSLSKLNFQFTVTSDVTAPTSQLSLDVSAAATNWYSSASAQPFGGQFSVTVPFTLQSTGTLTTTTSGSGTGTTSGSTTPSLVSKIQSVAVTAINEQGTSNSLNTPIQ
jgi:ASPM-SPD-2-Hydin domain-containing protein